MGYVVHIFRLPGRSDDSRFFLLAALRRVTDVLLRSEKTDTLLTPDFRRRRGAHHKSGHRKDAEFYMEKQKEKRARKRIFIDVSCLFKVLPQHLHYVGKADRE
jgi:hypothetical protein